MAKRNDDGAFRASRSIPTEQTDGPVVGLPGYYQQIADDIIASGEPLRRALIRLLDTFKSHVDGRDLLDELHPRKTLDIRRRVDGRETWFEGDWLSNVKDARDIALAVLQAADRTRTIPSQTQEGYGAAQAAECVTKPETPKC